MKEDDYTEIYRFLNGEMSGEERRSFERRLEGEPELAEEVAFNQDLARSIALYGDKTLKARIGQTHSRLEEKGFLQAAQTGKTPSGEADAPPRAKLRRLFPVRALAVAATVLLLLAVGYYLYPTTDTTQQLYSAHYQPDEEALKEQLEKLSLVGMAIPDKARRESLSAALNIFQSGNFDAASEALGQHLEAWPEDEPARYFLALSLMETGQFGEAAATFQPLTTRAGTAYYDKALWYQGLSYLRLPGRQARAKSIFTLLAVVPSSGYQKQAEEILKGLE